MEQLFEQFTELNDSSVIINKIAEEIVADICKDLDTTIQQIRQILVEDTLTNSELEDAVIQLPLKIYAITTQQEFLGLKDDLAAAKVKEQYNKIYLETQGKSADKVVIAQQGTIQQSIISSITSRCYKIVKQKIDAAYEVLNSVKKIINMRVQEME